MFAALGYTGCLMEEETMTQIRAVTTITGMIAAAAMAGCSEVPEDAEAVQASALTAESEASRIDRDLTRVLREAGFTGTIESTLQSRLHRAINPQLADLGRLIWFDKAGGLHSDNTCAGCHSPTDGFGDTQSIAIGVQNNNLV